MNWLERARREIRSYADQATAKTAEGNPMAVTAVVPQAPDTAIPLSIGSNGSAPTALLPDFEAIREIFEERAAILEYDAGMTRPDAERAAQAIVSKYLLH